MKRSFPTVVILGLSILASAGPLAAQSGAPPDAARKVKASLIAEHPAIAPGEVITDALVDYLQEIVANGAFFEGAADTSLQKLRVVAT